MGCYISGNFRDKQVTPMTKLEMQRESMWLTHFHDALMRHAVKTYSITVLYISGEYIETHRRGGHYLTTAYAKMCELRLRNRWYSNRETVVGHSKV